MENPLQDLIDRRLAGSQGQIPNDEDSEKLLPTLWSFLTRKSVNDELEKDPASVTLRLGLGVWLVQLTDPSLEVSLVTAVPQLHKALEALEVAVRAPGAPWQLWKGKEGSFRKRNKRTS